MYYKLAINDIEVAEHLLSARANTTNDEAFIDAAAFHTQQGIEKLLKHVLHDICEMSDEARSFRTHSISSLIDQVERQSELKISDEFKQYAEDITGWETATRYLGSQINNIHDIREAIRLFDELCAELEQVYPGMQVKSEEPKQPTPRP